jgi:hypothetical protein
MSKSGELKFSWHLTSPVAGDHTFSFFDDEFLVSGFRAKTISHARRPVDGNRICMG